MSAVDGPTPTVPTSAAAAASPPAFRWPRVIELGYADDGRGDAATLECQAPVCFCCGATDAKLSKCARCQVALYCSRKCQVTHWKGGNDKVGHKQSCPAYKRVGEDMMIVFGVDKDAARQEILSRIRFYAYPYAVHRASVRGRGFLFVQSDATLAALSLPEPVLSNGRACAAPRSVLLHWLTPAEYDAELCRDDFELAMARTELKEAVKTHDEKKEVPVLMRFRCGHVAVGVAPLVPDFRLCAALGKEYYGSGAGEGALQLNIDDM